MIRFLILIGLLAFCAIETFAANPAIIYGSGGLAQTIPNNGIALSSGVQWRDLSADPTVTATIAPQGSFGAFGANLYIKQDAGSTTNWNLVSTGVYISPITTEGDLIIGDGTGSDSRLGIGLNGKVLKSDGTTASWGDVEGTVPTLAKGSLLTSNGTVNGEFTACADGEIVVWDAAEVAGFRCAAAYTSTLTTDGDLLMYNAGEVRLPAGTENQLLTMIGGFASWQPAPVSTTLTTKGDIQTFDTANQRLPVGANNSFLVADSAETTGLKWSDSITGLISQAQFVGSLTYQEADCIWVGTSTTYDGFPVDADCDASNILGDVAAPDTKIPAIKILNARTDGYYEVKWQGLYFSSGGSCLITLSSSTSFDNQGTSSLVETENRRDNTLLGNFKFTTGGDKSIQVIHDLVNGSSCQVAGRDDVNSKFTVHFFPDSNSLAAVQNKTLNAQTANELSAIVTGGTPVVSSENFDWLGACSLTSTGNVSCNINSGIFTQTPVCHVTAQRNLDNNRYVISAYVRNVSTSTLDFSWSLADDNQASVAAMVYSDNSTNFRISCSKQGADVNKSQVITGTFENINDTDLVKVVASRPTTQVITSGGWQTIEYNVESTDNTSSFSNGVFTAPKAANYLICGKFLVTNKAYSLTKIVLSRILTGSGGDFRNDYFEATTTAAQLLQLGKCQEIELAENETAEFQAFQNQGTNITLTADGVWNHLTITELPTTQAIIASLGGSGTTVAAKAQIQSHNGTDNANVSSPSTDNQYLVSKADAADGTGLAWSSSITTAINAVTDVADIPCTSSWSSSVTTSCKSSRIGDRAYIEWELIATGDPAANGALVLNMPTGYTMDTDKILGTDSWGRFGACSINRTGTAYKIDIIYLTPTSFYVTYVANSTSFSEGVVNPTAPIALAANSKISCNVTVPIVGWQSGITAAIQEKELTAETANELTAHISAAGVVSRENYDWIDGNCVVSATSQYLCTYVVGLVTSQMNCNVTTEQGTSGILATIRASSSTTVTTNTELSTSAAVTPRPHVITCSKQGADVNKSQVITGTFEGINTSNVTSIQAHQSAAITPFLTGVATTVKYDTEDKDVNNNFNPATGVFTATKAETLTVCPKVLWDNASWNVGSRRQMRLVASNPSATIEISRDETLTADANYYQQGKCIDIDVVEGQSFYTQISHNSDAAKTIITSPNTYGYNTISIQGSPDTDAIIANLNDNNNVECTKKTLTTSVTSTGIFMTFNNLEIGKKYSFNASFLCTETTTPIANSGCVVVVSNGSQSVGSSDDRTYNNAGDINNIRKPLNMNNKFIATATTVTVNLNEIVSSAQLFGAGVAAQKFAEVCELPDNTLLNSTKFN